MEVLISLGFGEFWGDRLYWKCPQSLQNCLFPESHVKAGEMVENGKHWKRISYLTAK